MKGGRGMFFWTEFIELILAKGTLPKEHPPSPLHKGDSCIPTFSSTPLTFFNFTLFALLRNIRSFAK